MSFRTAESLLKFRSQIDAMAPGRDKSNDGIDHIVLAATRNDLRQAADFKTLREQKAERTARHTPGAPVVPVKLTTPPP